MGKGDKKTRRGKIVKGSYGVSRPKKKKKPVMVKKEQPKPESKPKKQAVKKAEEPAKVEETKAQSAEGKAPKAKTKGHDTGEKSLNQEVKKEESDKGEDKETKSI